MERTFLPIGNPDFIGSWDMFLDVSPIPFVLCHGWKPLVMVGGKSTGEGRRNEEAAAPALRWIRGTAGLLTLCLPALPFSLHGQGQSYCFCLEIWNFLHKANIHCFRKIINRILSGLLPQCSPSRGISVFNLRLLNLLELKKGMVFSNPQRFWVSSPLNPCTTLRDIQL